MSIFLYDSVFSAFFCPDGLGFMLRFSIIDRVYKSGLYGQLRLHGKEEFARNTFQAKVLSHDDRLLLPKTRTVRTDCSGNIESE